jgi:BCD family chlorophyll transporter-like MFS transporter
METPALKPLGWLGIARLGLVQMALGSIVVLTTSTLNRVMVVELALPAMLPGALVALHYAMGLLRPRWGHGSDRSRRTPWIVGGVAALATGGVLAAWATTLMAQTFATAVALAVLAFALIGAGVGMAGTALLALLATRVAPARRPAAATIVWLMMIFGLAVTAATAGQLLDPYSPDRLLAVAVGVAALALALTALAVRGMEGAAAAEAERPSAPFRTVLRECWAEPAARRFSIFVFVSMLAFSAQDLILEPFAGHVFGMTVGESTTLAAKQQSGIFFGMVLVAALGSAVGGRLFGSLKMWTVLGCLCSGAALAGLAVGAFAPGWPLAVNVFLLGFANGMFAVASIGSMMALAGADGGGREGARMGLWGAAQATAFGLGGFLGAASVDAARALTGAPDLSYAAVFSAEAALFVAAAALALGVGRPRDEGVSAPRAPARAADDEGAAAPAAASQTTTRRAMVAGE